MRRIMRRSSRHDKLGPRAPGLLGLTLLCVATAALAEPAGHSLVALDSKLAAFTVDACFSQSLAGRVRLAPSVPPQALIGLAPLGDDHPGVYRARESRDQCIHYALDLMQLPPGDRQAHFSRVPGAILLDPSWLFAIPTVATLQTLEVEVLLPHGMHLAAPVAIDAGSRTRFTLSTRAWGRGGRLAFGTVQRTEHQIAGSTLLIDVVGQSSVAEQRKFNTWVTEVAATLANLSGRLPVPQVEVLVVPEARDPDVVPWGEVLRASSDAVLLCVDRTRTTAELAADWVALHEFSHLLHPTLARGDSWLSEGLASYYQNVLHARLGRGATEIAWRALLAGFARGRAETDGTLTLAEATQQMRLRGLFMRVYWSGAAMMLAGDVELRLRTHGVQSLPRVLDQFARCCLPATREWSATEMLTRWDQLAGVEVFAPLARRTVTATTFPDLAPTLGVLGIAEHAPLFSTADASARLRDAIMVAPAP